MFNVILHKLFALQYYLITLARYKCVMQITLLAWCHAQWTGGVNNSYIRVTHVAECVT